MGKYKRGDNMIDDDKVFREVIMYHLIKTLPFFSKAAIARYNRTTRQNVSRIELKMIPQYTEKKLEQIASSKLNKSIIEAIIKLLDAVDEIVP